MTKTNEIIIKAKDYPFKTHRLDKWMAEVLNISDLHYQDDMENKTIFSRTKIKNLILSGNVMIDEIKINDPSLKLKKENIIKIVIPEIINDNILPQNIPLNIVYEMSF